MISFHFPDPLQPGDIVEITLVQSAFYQQKGTLIREGDTGGWYIQFDQQKEPVYIPFGYKKALDRV